MKKKPFFLQTWLIAILSFFAVFVVPAIGAIILIIIQYLWEKKRYKQYNNIDDLQEEINNKEDKLKKIEEELVSKENKLKIFEGEYQNKINELSQEVTRINTLYTEKFQKAKEDHDLKIKEADEIKEYLTSLKQENFILHSDYTYEVSKFAIDEPQANTIQSQKSIEPVVGISIQNSDVPQKTLDDMRQCYTNIQATDDLRILKDCFDIISETTNLETYFVRKELAMRKLLTLEQARKAGVPIVDLPLHSKEFLRILESQKVRVLQDSFKKLQFETEALKTVVGKANRINRYYGELLKYEDEFEFEGNEQYTIIINLLKPLLKDASEVFGV